MAHPSGAHRAHHHEKHRVGHITGHYGASRTGNATIANRVTPSDRSLEKKAFNERDSQAVEGGVPKERFDRPGRSLRARGGRTKHKGNTTVNIIMPSGGAGAGGAGVAAPVPRPAPPPPAPAPMAGPPAGAGVAPPMMGGLPPGAPLPAGGGMPPRPGMMPPGVAPPGMPMRARGGRLPKGTKVWREGVADGTQVQNNPAGKNDQHDVDRGKPITYAKGGAVKRASGGSAEPTSEWPIPRYTAEFKKMTTPEKSKYDAGVKTKGPVSDTGMDTTKYDEVQGEKRGGRVKRRATGGAVHFFGDADMGIPHPFKGKDFSGNTKHITPKKGRDDPPGEGKMPTDKRTMHSATESEGHTHASVDKGPFSSGTMKAPTPKAGPKEAPKGVIGKNVGWPHQGGAGGARARIAKQRHAYK